MSEADDDATAQLIPKSGPLYGDHHGREVCCCGPSQLYSENGPCDCNFSRACCTSLNSMTARYYAFEDQTAASAHSCCNRMLRWLSCRSRRSASESDAPVADLGDDEDSCMRCSVRGASMLVLTVREVGWILAFYIIYTLAKYTTYVWYPDVEGTANENAHDILSLEQSIGFAHEVDWQNWVLNLRDGATDDVMWVFIVEYMYFSGVYGTLLLFLAILFITPQHFAFARTWFWVTSLLAVTTFSIFPATPPRLLPGFDITDALVDIAGWNLFTKYADVYAAFPSMHVGWAFLVSSYYVYILCKDRVRWYISVPLALLCIGYPFSVWFATVSTGYHWIIDGVGGIVYVAVGCFLTVYMVGSVGDLDLDSMEKRVVRLLDAGSLESGQRKRRD